ncbi:MAG: tetratricopeptide repeat protein, partial [Sandaracinaceae bacterium]|nr:tetratricopeptide repeat protein [Sandaracinaceae bacterium]
MARADQALAQGRTARATQLLRSAVRRAPTDPRVAQRLAALVPADPRPAPASRGLAAEARGALGRANDSSVASRRALAWCTALAGDHAAGVDIAVGAAGLQD